MAKNYYFTVVSPEMTVAESIPVAYELCKTGLGGDGFGIEIRECGTKQVVAIVYPDGRVDGSRP